MVRSVTFDVSPGLSHPDEMSGLHEYTRTALSSAPSARRRSSSFGEVSPRPWRRRHAKGTRAEAIPAWQASFRRHQRLATPLSARVQAGARRRRRSGNHNSSLLTFERPVAFLPVRVWIRGRFHPAELACARSSRRHPAEVIIGTVRLLVRTSFLPTSPRFYLLPSGTLLALASRLGRLFGHSPWKCANGFQSGGNI